MKIAIIGAMMKETQELINKLNNRQITIKEPYTFNEGEYCGNDLIVTTSGIGKTSSGVIIGVLCMLYPNIDLIINMGISGGIAGKVNPGDIVISEKLAYADVDVTIDNYKYGEIPGMPDVYEGFPYAISLITGEYKKGMILTGDTFYANKDKVNEILKHFPGENILAMDMESAALAQGAYIMGIPYIAIRAISDVIGSVNQKDNYYDYCLIACTKATKALKDILKGLKVQ